MIKAERAPEKPGAKRLAFLVLCFVVFVCFGVHRSF